MNPISEPFEFLGIIFTPIPVIHGNLIFGYRFGNTAYITDAKVISDESIKLLSGIEIMVVNALRPGKDPYPTHFSFEEAFDFIMKTSAKRIYLVHMCHLVNHAESQQFFDDLIQQNHSDKQIFVGIDGLVIEGINPYSKLD